MMTKITVQNNKKKFSKKLRPFIKPLLLLCVIALFQACTTTSYNSKWIAPHYTNVSKITQLKSGMSVEEINRSLGIDPYDVYHIQQDGSTVLVYNYRVKERRMDVSKDPVEREHTIRNEERSQTEGEVWYTEANQVFILLKDNKMKSLISDAGLENSSYLLLQNNNIQLISKKEMAALKDGNTDNAGSQIIVPLKSDRKKPTEKDQTVVNQKKGSAALGVLGVLAALTVLIVLAVASAE